MALNLINFTFSNHNDFFQFSISHLWMTRGIGNTAGRQQNLVTQYILRIKLKNGHIRGCKLDF